MNRHAPRIALSALFVLALLSTRIFVDIERVRVRLIDQPASPSGGAIRIVSTAVAPLVVRSHPSALIARVDNRAGDVDLAISVDGAVICRPRVTAGASRRIDCAVPQWSASREAHEFHISGPPEGWVLASLEAATHHGNSSEPVYLVVLPRDSQNYVAPSGALKVFAGLLLAAALWFIPPVRLSRPAAWLHGALSGVVVTLLVVIAAVPWVSQYRVVASFRTLCLLLVVLAWPVVLAAWRWLGQVQPVPLTAGTRLARPAVVGLCVFAVFATVVADQLQRFYDGKYSGFVKISRRMFESNPVLVQREALRPEIVLLDNDGFDGQYMYFTAFDPLMRMFRGDPAKYQQVVDAVPYRYGRIGFGLMTRIAAGGRAPQFPAAMMWLILIALFALAFLVAYQAQASGVTPLAGLLIVLIPGFWQSVQSALPEPISAVFLVGGLAAAVRSRYALSGALFAVALLIRESGAVLVVCVAAAAALSGRWRPAMTVGLLAIVPTIAWRAYVGWTMLPVSGLNGFLDHPPILGWPFAGFPELWQLIGSGNYYGGDVNMARAGITYPLLLTGALGVAVLMTWAAPAPVVVAAACYGLLAVSMNFDWVWEHMANGQRTTYELFLLLAMSVTGLRTWGRQVQIALLLLWCAAGAYVFWGAFDAGVVRSALLWPD
jgi:hypothetical protein